MRYLNFKKINILLKLSRIHTPIGIFLLFFPCCFGVTISRLPVSQHYSILWIFLLGSIMMRSAGCIFNDLIDKDFDKQVKRTKNRPLANGIISISDAIILMVVFVVISIIIALQLSVFSIILCGFALILVLIYPFMKRITHCPQLFLGLTFNFGVLVAYAQVTGKIDFLILSMYLACIFWTLGYDTIYAFMDIKDDQCAQIKSFALVIKDLYPKIWLGTFYFIFISLFSAVSLTVKTQFSILSLTAILTAIIILAWQIVTLDIEDQNNCLVRFKSNNYVGLVLYLFMIL